MSEFGDLVGAIDEGTSSARFALFKAGTPQIVCYHQIQIRQIVPNEGWVEQDPMEMLKIVRECIDKTIEKLIDLGGSPADIVGIGVTNQRESTIVWDRNTGQPLHNALLWLDVRTSVTVDSLTEQLPHKNKNHYHHLCGLPLSTYFSGVKLRWLKDNIPHIADAMENSECLFGTIDSWLIWNLTGGPSGGVHITDVSNASRTMLMNIKTCQWENELLNFFGIPSTILPEIRSSSEIYGHVTDGPLKGIPLCGCLGDQQAALVGQHCLSKGQAKATYGTGCFLLYNTGEDCVISSQGLLTTVAYQFGPKAKPVYAIEGSVAIAGAAITWLRDNLDVIENENELTEIINTVDDCGEVYFVPAFSGLYAPYWKQEARGVIYGLTENTQRGHIIRATLEAVCFQVRDILEAMNKDSNLHLLKLQVDGGMTQNKMLLQVQADLIGLEVTRPEMAESTSLGVAIAAGRAVGKWDINQVLTNKQTTFSPRISKDHRNQRYKQWKKAIERAIGWDI